MCSHLAFPVDADDAGCGLVRSRHKDCLSADPVHVHTDASLQVVEMDVAVLCYEVNHIVF